MSYFAVLDENNVIINLIVSDSVQIAESITNKVCIEYKLPMIGGTYENGEFVDAVEYPEIPVEENPTPEQQDNP